MTNHATNPHFPDNLTSAEAAEYFRASERTLIRWRSARTGPKFTRVGGKVLYRRSDLDAFMAERTVEPVAAQ